MAKVNKQQLLAILDDIRRSVEENDTMEGQISYNAMADGLEPGEFEIKGVYRIGNSMGQGGVRMLT